MERRNLLRAVIALGACPVCARSASAAGADWGYEGHEGPAHWGELSKDYFACSSGTQQSPIDIADAVRAEIPDLAIAWHEGGATMTNTGYSIQIDMPEGSTLTRGENAYKLLQFHFHAPSEHQMDGRTFPVEAHFVHRDVESDALAVLAVFLTPGGANPGFSNLASAFPAKAGEQISLDKVDPEGLLPASLGYWMYAGSLTTPPCTENVEWIVAMEPVEVDDADIERLTRLYPMNTRPIQSLDRRVILALP